MSNSPQQSNPLGNASLVLGLGNLFGSNYIQCHPQIDIYLDRSLFVLFHDQFGGYEWVLK